MRHWRAWTAVWLVLLTLAQFATFAAVWWFFLRTATGQRLDTIALTGNSIGRSRIEEPVNTILNAMSVVSVAVAMIFLGFVALARRRVLVAVLTGVLIVGANVTTQLLKRGLHRPDFGVDEARELAGNSFPSGHTTVAASVAVALLLALPTKVRAVGALIGTVFAGAAGIATLSAGWHRPSDAVGAMLVVGVWAGVIGLVLVAAQRTPAERPEPHLLVSVMLALTGAALLVVAIVGLQFTDQVVLTPPEDLSRRRLFAAYAGSAAGIAATACWMMALVLAAIHRVIPPSSVERVEFPAGTP